jgi:methylthioribose-1-phosphate isomerase
MRNFPAHDDRRPPLPQPLGRSRADLSIIDQTRLPHAFETRSRIPEAVAEAIETMRVRGALSA